MGAEASVHAALDRLAGGAGGLGIALSGGGDSTALMHFAHRWGRARLMAATVDHGLRPASGDEARRAAAAAARLGIAHETLIWAHDGADDRAGNLMARARDARLTLLADWAVLHGLDAVLLGHTQDDQAETLLMRLDRGAGIDGLSAMAPRRRAAGMTWLRPMLDISRAGLRDWLLAQGMKPGLDWVEDPTNENADYARVRARQAIAALDLPVPQLARAAQNLAMARDALRVFAAQVAQGTMAQAGALRLPLAAFLDAPTEIRRRLLVAGLRHVSGAPYPPRRAPVMAALDSIAAGRRLTLDGVIAAPHGPHLHLFREPAAARRSPPATGDPAVWDGRWRISGLVPGHEVRALGHGALPGLAWRDSGLTWDEAAASPGIWSGATLMAAPLLAGHDRITVQALRGLVDFHALLDTH